MKTLDELTLRKHEDIDIIFVNPGNLNAVYQSLASEFSAIETPSMIALFASYMRTKQATVEIIDAPAFELSPEQVATIIAEHFNPVLIVMVVYGYQPSASTQNMPAASVTCSAIKKLSPNFKVLMTGTHPAALPELTLREEDVNFVCSGEGPETIFQVMNRLKNNDTDFSVVPNLHYFENDMVKSTPPGSLISDLDAAMPEPALDLLPMEKYRAHNWHCFEDINNRQPYVSIHTSLGCPYRCSFCCINAPFGKSSYRMWSPDNIIKQIDVLVNDYSIKNIKIVDEMFVLNKNHVLGICERIIERGYDLNIWAYARIDTIKDEYLDSLKKAGIRWLALGIESASKHVRDGVEKGRFGTDDILKIIKKIKNADINIIGNFIFGLPDDDLGTMQETLDLAIEANCEFANFYSAMAYPGSPLYAHAKKQGWKLPDSWIGYSQHSYETLPLPTDHISAAEVLKFRDEAFTKYFSNKRYLDLVKNKFGDDVYSHIEKMLEIKLDRAIYN
jgi:radical SAM superfamily enzyme YgiQ (UPF0313 family)